MDRVMRGASVAIVVGLGIPPWMDVATIEHPNQRALATGIFLLALAAGVWAAVRRQPLGARFTTIVYGALTIGFGLFVVERSTAFLLAYVVGLMGMNVLLYHVQSFGPVLAAFTEDDAASRRARAVVLRSLGITGASLAIAYGGSLVLLPVFASPVGATDPIVAMLLAILLVLVLLLLALLPDGLPGLRRRGLRAR